MQAKIVLLFSLIVASCIVEGVLPPRILRRNSSLLNQQKRLERGAGWSVQNVGANCSVLSRPREAPESGISASGCLEQCLNSVKVPLGWLPAFVQGLHDLLPVPMLKAQAPALVGDLCGFITMAISRHANASINAFNAIESSHAETAAVISGHRRFFSPKCIPAKPLTSEERNSGLTPPGKLPDFLQPLGTDVSLKYCKDLRGHGQELTCADSLFLSTSGFDTISILRQTGNRNSKCSTSIKSVAVQIEYDPQSCVLAPWVEETANLLQSQFPEICNARSMHWGIVHLAEETVPLARNVEINDGCDLERTPPVPPAALLTCGGLGSNRSGRNGVAHQWGVVDLSGSHKMDHLQVNTADAAMSFKAGWSRAVACKYAWGMLPGVNFRRYNGAVSKLYSQKDKALSKTHKSEEILRAISKKLPDWNATDLDCSRILVLNWIHPQLCGHGSELGHIVVAINAALFTGRVLVVSGMSSPQWPFEQKECPTFGCWLQPVSSCTLPPLEEIEKAPKLGSPQSQNSRVVVVDSDVELPKYRTVMPNHIPQTKESLLHWISMLGSIAFRPTAASVAKFRKLYERSGFPAEHIYESNGSQACVAVHIRRGHKWIEFESPPVADTAEQARHLLAQCDAQFRKPCIVFAASESSSALAELQSSLPNRQVMWTVHPRPHWRISIPLSIRMNLLQRDEENLVAWANLNLLSKCSYFVGALSSGYSRRITELSFGRHSHPIIQSSDVPWNGP